MSRPVAGGACPPAERPESGGDLQPACRARAEEGRLVGRRPGKAASEAVAQRRGARRARASGRGSRRALRRPGDKPGTRIRKTRTPRVGSASASRQRPASLCGPSAECGQRRRRTTAWRWAGRSTRRMAFKASPARRGPCRSGEKCACGAKRRVAEKCLTRAQGGRGAGADRVHALRLGRRALGRGRPLQPLLPMLGEATSPTVACRCASPPLTPHPHPHPHPRPHPHPNQVAPWA